MFALAARRALRVASSAPVRMAAASASTAAAAPAALTSSSTPAFLDSIDTFLFDCDGVLWRGGVGIPRVGATIAALEARGKRCFYVTNNSTKTREQYVRVLADVAGIAATRDAVLSSAYAAAVYLREAGVKKKVYVIGSVGLEAELREVAGVECVGAADADHEFAFGVVSPETLDPDVQAVVIGFDPRCVGGGGEAGLADLPAAHARRAHASSPVSSR